MVTTPNLGPATAPFAPPTSCLKTTTYTEYWSDDGQTVGPHGSTLGTDPDCFPPSPPTAALVRPHQFRQAVLARHLSSWLYLCAAMAYFPYFYPVDSEGCTERTDFVRDATGTDNNLPPFTAVTIFPPGGRYVEVTASAIIVAWQGKDQEVLDALVEYSVSVDWPPAARRNVLLGVLTPIGALDLTAAAYIFYLARKGRLRCLQLPTESGGVPRDIEGQKPSSQREVRELPADSVPAGEADSRPVIPARPTKAAAQLPAEHPQVNQTAPPVETGADT
ncbi:hypothetical protein C8A03DRAFT_37016 [Achaetomium macrosporum]|uniref:Uncharacterized protein n=1 Tax=Achaetomium macrosporum TaxID=79813 RepID=A0AAN7H958_9PEZI|nr:hypothetical protein C8A03DRAFT_37016 [Achaetomium macrosporum]